MGDGEGETKEYLLQIEKGRGGRDDGNTTF